jgi:predicted nuclease with TOPRIM domain
MKHPSELAERLLEHWRSTGMTLCVEAAAQIEAQRERIAQLDDEALRVARRNSLLVIECDDLKTRCNRLTHQLQELEAREQ